MSNINNNTLFIEVLTKGYPFNLTDIKARNNACSFGDDVTSDDLEILGFAVVTQVAKSEGDIVIEDVPALVDGVRSEEHTSELQSQP